MPRALGTTLLAHPLIFVTCCGGCRCRRVPHHDHIYDAFHQDLLDMLSPVDPARSRHRPDSGRAFNEFLRGRSTHLFERIAAERTRSSLPLIRFPTTLVCDRVNAVDGNGKVKERPRRADPEDLTYWSMTPEELLQVHSGRRTWKKVLDADVERHERRSRVKELARTLVDEYQRPRV